MFGKDKWLIVSAEDDDGVVEATLLSDENELDDESGDKDIGEQTGKTDVLNNDSHSLGDSPDASQHERVDSVESQVSRSMDFEQREQRLTAFKEFLKYKKHRRINTLFCVVGLLAAGIVMVHESAWPRNPSHSQFNSKAIDSPQCKVQENWRSGFSIDKGSKVSQANNIFEAIQSSCDYLDFGLAHSNPVFGVSVWTESYPQVSKTKSSQHSSHLTRKSESNVKKNLFCCIGQKCESFQKCKLNTKKDSNRRADSHAGFDWRKHLLRNIVARKSRGMDFKNCSVKESPVRKTGPSMKMFCNQTWEIFCPSRKSTALEYIFLMT